MYVLWKSLPLDLYWISKETISVNPFAAAMCKAVSPLAPSAWTFAPLSSKNLTTSVCPFSEAITKGVAPLLKIASKLAPFLTKYWIT